VPTGYVQEKFETNVAGNETNAPTLSTKIFYPPVIGFTPDPGTKPMERDDELRGSEEPLSVIPEAFDPTWAIRGRAYPDHTGWRLKHILGPPTTTAGNGVITDPDAATIPTGAYRHVWKSTDASWGKLSGSALANPMTAQMIAAYKDQGVFVKIKGAACDTLGIDNPESGGVTLSANGPALFLDDTIADPALTPSYEAAATTPFLRGNLSLPTWLTGSGTKDDFGLQIAAPADRVRSMGSGSKWADIMEVGDGLLVVTGSVALHQLDPQDVAALRASTGFAIKAKWLNDTVIASGYKHSLWVEGANGQYVGGGPAALANTRRIGGSFNFKLTTAGSGVATTITLCNSTASYA
jgi:hypothetical protein